MRLILSLTTITLLGGLLLTACNSAEQKPPASASSGAPSSAAPAFADGVRRITPNELRNMLANNEAVAIDVRNEDAYSTAHIRGAKLIPEAEVAKRSDELPKNKLIVTYCSWPNEHTSARAVVDLKAKGINNAAALLGGFVAWQNAGFPIDKKQ
jgi:rhodanese-related sulfurtransferase